MRGKIKQLRQNDFVRHNAVFFAGSMAVALVNYLYYPVVGRLVSTVEFGEIQALISIFLQVALLLSILADVTVNVVANAKVGDASGRTVIEFGRFATFVMALIVLVAIVCIQPLKHFLKFDDAWPFVITGLALIIGASSTMRAAYLRGKSAFGKLSLSSLITATTKLLASLLLVLLGFGTSGAIGGLLVASIVTWVYTRRATTRLGLSVPPGTHLFRLPDMQLIKPQLPFATLVLIVSLVTTALFSVDVVLAKHYFSAQVAGEYAGIATVGRIIYYVTGSVAAVLLSSVQLSKTPKQNRSLFLRSLGLTTLLGGSALLAFTIAPHFFVSTLIGGRYLPLSGLLPKLSLTLFLISIINLVFSYDVALRRWSIAAISVVGAFITVLLMLGNHRTPSAMINSLLIGSVVLLAIRGLDSVRRNLPRASRVR